jgi:hypothetical protein
MHHFASLVQISKARDADLQFTWKLFPHTAEVNILLSSFESFLKCYSLPLSERLEMFFSPFLVRSASRKNRRMKSEAKNIHELIFYIFSMQF